MALSRAREPGTNIGTARRPRGSHVGDSGLVIVASETADANGLVVTGGYQVFSPGDGSHRVRRHTVPVSHL